ncbi:glycosyltransferase [Candidatus Parcubacteria bacterium]|nr:glycosyltransferase [Candidatus Parcubacteria bacterium]
MLSIIIPTLNEEEYLPFLLGSIKKQTFQDYEIIVANANSRDKTKQIAKEQGCLLVQGGLPSVGRNRGAEAADGDLLLFLDADVILPPNFLKEILREFKTSQLDIASCFVSPLSDKGIDNILYGFGNLYYAMSQHIEPQAPGYCILIKKKIHQIINGFDEKIKIAEDWDYISRASKEGKFRFLSNGKIFVSMRRFERDGRINVAFQRVIGTIYVFLFGGIKSDVLFKYYRFGDYPERALKPIVNCYTKFFNQVSDKWFKD